MLKRDVVRMIREVEVKYFRSKLKRIRISIHPNRAQS